MLQTCLNCGGLYINCGELYTMEGKIYVGRPCLCSVSAEIGTPDETKRPMCSGSKGVGKGFGETEAEGSKLFDLPLSTTVPLSGPSLIADDALRGPGTGPLWTTQTRPAPKQPYLCPVCGGRCRVHLGFYDGVGPGVPCSMTAPPLEPCRSCGGTGVIIT